MCRRCSHYTWGGGLGHLGIQFAAKMGFKTIAIARGKDKEEMVKKLGAIDYIDSQSQNVVEELAKMGDARVILATVPSGKAMSAVLGALGVNGKLIIIGASDEAAPSAYQSIHIRTSINSGLVQRVVNRFSRYPYL